MKPDVNVTIGTDLPARPAPGDTGTAFVVGLADRGPVDTPVLVRSKSQLVTYFGPRVTYSPLYDVADVAFRRGLDHMWVVRRVGPAAVTASKNLVATATPVLEITGTSPGAWANEIDVEITKGVTEGTFHVRVSFEDELVEASPELANNAAAVAWAATSSYIRLKALTETDPDAQKVALSSGADDRNNVDEDVIEAGLALFTPDLGPGQVAAPGYVDEAVQAAVMAHCKATNRIPVLDGEDSDEADDLIAQVGALRSLPGARQTSVFAPWDVVPGVAAGTFRTVPPCARQLGATAAVDAASGTSNVAAAGEAGKDTYPVRLSQTYSDDDQSRLNDAGVNISIIDEGVVTTNGWRTLADPVTEVETWLALGAARQMIAMAAGVKKTLKRFLHKQVDAQGETRAAAEGACENEVIKPAFAARAIFGETESEAGRVVVEQDVKPMDGTIAKLTGTLAARPTKSSEVIEMTVVATNEAL